MNHILYKNAKSKVIIITLILILVLYISSYLFLQHMRYEIINTNNGPISLYNIFYYPLRLIDSKKPEYFDGYIGITKIKAKIISVNQGTGYTNFIWKKKEYRAGSDYDIVSYTQNMQENNQIILYIDYKLLTYDDFENYLIPYIIDVKTTK